MAWLGITDKYWLTALIPNNNDSFNVNFRHNNKNENDDFRTGYAGDILSIQPKSRVSYEGMLFVGAKVVRILNKYQENYNILRFNDVIDWGWF